MSKKLFEKYVVTVETVSETFIWSGKDLLIGYDVVFTGNKAYLIDHASLMNKLLEKGGLNRIIELEETIDKGIQLTSFLSRHDIKLDEVSSKTIKIKDNTILTRISLSKFIKENIQTRNLSYIPASEVKGVIRTAILNYLVYKQWIPPRIIDNAICSLSNWKTKEKNVGKNIEKTLEAVINYIVRGKRKSLFVDMLHYLQISDPMDMQVNEVIDSIVVLKKGAKLSTIPENPAIVIDPGSRFSYLVNIRNPIISLKSLNNIDSETISSAYRNVYDEFFDALRYFSTRLIDYEIQRLREYGNLDRPFIEKLEKWRREVEAGNAFYFKIGYGAGMYSKSIFLSMTEQQRRNLVNLMSRRIRAKTHGRIHVWDSLTMKVSGSEYHSGRLVPIGWVKITFNRI